VAVIHVLFISSDQGALEWRALADPINRKCPYCAEIIKAEAKVCKHCGRDVPAIEVPRYCRRCSIPLDDDQESCPNCGHDQSQPFVYEPVEQPKMTPTEKRLLTFVVPIPIFLLVGIFLIAQPIQPPKNQAAAQNAQPISSECGVSKPEEGLGCVDKQDHWHWYTDEEVRAGATSSTGSRAADQQASSTSTNGDRAECQSIGAASPASSKKKQK
jgi:RNA polymerase subunit RPABC4/transcription elongation factor Spt4